MKRALLLLVPALVATAVLPAPAVAADTKGPTIKKCRDATGRWHYGDTAAAACANAKVTVINEQGIKKREIAAPLTRDELKAREQQQVEAQEAKEQAKRDELLLATYAHEADIIYIRDRKLAQLESVIKASIDTLIPLRATLARLEAQAAAEEKANNSASEQTTKALEQTRSQITKHEAAIAQKRQEQETIKTQAQADLERYLELKSHTPRAAASAKP